MREANSFTKAECENAIRKEAPELRVYPSINGNRLMVSPPAKMYKA